MSLIINGESISKGICIGQAVHIDKNNIDYAPSYIKKSQIPKEVEKFKKSSKKNSFLGGWFLGHF